MNKKNIFISLVAFILVLLALDIVVLETGQIHSTAFMREDSSPKQQIWVPLSSISSYLRQAVIVSEDGTFYEHQGIDTHELKESIKTNLERGKFARGFSTITMQVARNLYLSRDKTIWRKLAEIAITFKLELLLSKQRILEIYLNVAEWGDGIYGAEAAARHYFQKSAAQLSKEEAVFLASILPSPRHWGKDPRSEIVQHRMNVIRRRMD